MKKITYLFLLSILTLILANCQNKSTDKVTSYRWQNGLCYNNLNQQVATTNCNGIMNTDYYIGSNGQCYSRLNNQAVAYQYCQTTGTNGYTYVNGRCILQSTGQEYPVSYCQQGVGGSQQCVGVYYVNQWQPIYCGTQVNCSGYTLYNSNWQIVTCQ